MYKKRQKKILLFSFLSAKGVIIENSIFFIGALPLVFRSILPALKTTQMLSYRRGNYGANRNTWTEYSRRYQQIILIDL